MTCVFAQMKEYHEDVTYQWEVDKILDKRGKGQYAEYLIQWLPSEGILTPDTWEPVANLVDCPELLAAFEAER